MGSFRVSASRIPFFNAAAQRVQPVYADHKIEQWRKEALDHFQKSDDSRFSWIRVYIALKRI